MFFRSPIVRFFNRILNRITITVVLVALQVAWLLWAFFSLTTGRVWVNAGLQLLSLLMMLYLVRKDENSAYKVGWIALIGILPLLGGALYLAFGNKRPSKRLSLKMHAVDSAHKKDLQQQPGVLDSLDADGQGQSRYVAKYGPYPAWQNTRAQYFASGEAMYPQLLADLEKAEKFIFLEYFIIAEGEMWNGVHEILLDKLKEGVKVYVMYDDVGSMPKVSPDFYKDLCKEGFDARKFHKFIPVVSVSHNNRDHRKIAVIDGKVGFMGGANIADEYANITKPYGRWLDCSVKIKGQAVDSLVRLFIQLFNMSGSPSLDERDFVSSSHEVYNDGYMFPFGDSPAPITEEHIGENVYLDIINRSDKYLYIATPYLIVDTNITTAIKNAARRGVDVRIFIPEVPDKKAIYIMTRSACISLMSAGVKVYAFRNGFIHSKCFLSDGDTAVIGTINLDFRSLVHHFECATLFFKNSVINDIYADFLYLIEHECDLVSADDLQLKPRERIVKWFLTFFAPLM